MEKRLEERSLSRQDFLKLGGAGLAGAALLGTGGQALAATSNLGQGSPSGSGGPSISGQEWGSVDGKAVHLYTLSNGRQMSVEITNYGAIVVSILVPDSAGRVGNVALGFSSLADYVENSTNPAPGGSGSTYFGATIGRYANRIAKGKLTLDGRTTCNL